MMRKILLAILVLFIAFFPYILSSPPGKAVIIWIAEAKMDAKIGIEKLRFSWMGPQKVEGLRFNTPDLNGSVSEILINHPFWAIASSQYAINVTGGSVESHSTGSIEQVNATINGRNIEASGITRSGNLTGKLSVQGSAASQDDFELTYSATSMPTAPVDFLLKANNLLNKTFGSWFEIVGSVSNKAGSGNLAANLNSPFSTAGIYALFTPTSITLQRPLQAKFPLTRELSQLLTKGELTVTGQDVVKISIASDNFFLPRPFSLNTLNISSASLSLGRINMQNPKFMHEFSDFLKAQFLARNGDLNAWLTRADFSFQKGLLDLGRIDTLLNQSLHLCTWGKLDFAKNKIDMILGIPADTLNKTFRISNVSPSYVLQIPVTGTIDDPQFDSAGATAKITTLIAATQTKQSGGIAGILSNVTSIANQVMQGPTPPPSEPIPWN